MKQYKNLVPIILLWLQCLLTVCEIFFVGPDYFGGFNWLWPLGLAWLMLSIDIILFFKKRAWFKYAVLITLLSGLSGLIRFTISKYYFAIGSSVNMDDISLLVCFLYLIMNFRSMFPAKIALAETQEEIQENIEQFKEQYTNRSSDELRAILQDSRYRADAKRAADEILQEREAE